MSDHNKAHATLSPSSAERWIECPASIRLTASMDRRDDSGSVWAAEGTRAHTLAEIEASHFFGLTATEDYQTFRAAWLRSAEEHGDDVEEMERHARSYVSLLADLQADMGPGTTVHLEKRMQTGIAGCWGTGDCVLVHPSKIRVVDYKYGRGVAVAAEDNPQLRLYGLGALEMFDGVLGDAETVGMTIHQPRVGSTSHEVMTAAALREWRETVARPAAVETLSPEARFGPSESACRWCPAAGICKVRAAHVIERDFGNPNLLNADELADAWRSLSEIRDWCNAVEAEALHQAYSENVSLPGLKVVLSGGRRSIADPEAAIDVLVGAGYTPEQVSRKSVRTFKDLERLIGKSRLGELLGDLLVRSPGKPALVDESDTRESITALTTAQTDFQDNSLGE